MRAEYVGRVRYQLRARRSSVIMIPTGAAEQATRCIVMLPSVIFRETSHGERANVNQDNSISKVWRQSTQTQHTQCTALISSQADPLKECLLSVL